MIIFLDDILNGNIQELLSEELYQQAIATVVTWWAVLPMMGLCFAFGCIMLSLFQKGGKS